MCTQRGKVREGHGYCGFKDFRMEEGKEAS